LVAAPDEDAVGLSTGAEVAATGLATGAAATGLATGAALGEKTQLEAQVGSESRYVFEQSLA
jgi:hypothetical protein